MMKIKNVEVFPIEFPLEYPSQDATGIWYNWSTVIVKITAEDGTCGYGEIGPIHGGGIPIFTSIVNYRLKNLIIGENCFDRERLYEKMLGRGTSAYALGSKGAAVSAVAGIDIALYDLAGKLLDTPAYNLLGGKFYDKIPAYASGFFGIKGRALTPQECGDEAKQYADQGFKGIKMKIGFGLEKDMANLEAVREALGPDLGIMVDANQCFDYPMISQHISKYADFNITFIEEPIRINDLQGMANLSATSGVGIAAGENYYTKYEFREIFEKRAVNYIQPDIIHAGGISETKKIAAMSSAYDVPLCPHIHASVGVSAAIQLLGSCENTFAAEYITSGGSYQLRKELCGNSYMVKDGYVPVSDAPGLGIEIDESVFEKYYPKNIKC
jgi:L-alanine-DL-glutamate epimerase-like enolase superfamily enzyme